ncbi:hypothetical protein [Streptomyces adustus]|uniref:hypothetical protein n=1 Tax=Streptomyces adustus TaxID=1609272 RepID=UPI0012E08562|nr:hypothetical protein [Streptomyces adustus]
MKGSESIFSRVSGPEMSCCGSRSFATVTDGESCSGHSMVMSFTGMRARSVQSWTWMSKA